MHLLLIFILRIQSRIISQAYHEHLPPFHGSLILMAVLAGVFYGTIHGLASYYLDRKLLSNLSMGRAVLIKAAASIVVLLTVLPVMKYFWFDHFFSSTHPLSQPLLNETSF